MHVISGCAWSHVWVWVHSCQDIHVKARGRFWVPVITIQLVQGRVSLLFCCVGHAGWFIAFRNSISSSHLLVGVLAHTCSCCMFFFYMGSAIQIQVIMIVWQVLLPPEPSQRLLHYRKESYFRVCICHCCQCFAHLPSKWTGNQQAPQNLTLLTGFKPNGYGHWQLKKVSLHTPPHPWGWVCTAATLGVSDRFSTILGVFIPLGWRHVSLWSQS